VDVLMRMLVVFATIELAEVRYCSLAKAREAFSGFGDRQLDFWRAISSLWRLLSMRRERANELRELFSLLNNFDGL
jgi:hypothetical protein